MSNRIISPNSQEMDSHFAKTYQRNPHHGKGVVDQNIQSESGDESSIKSKENKNIDIETLLRGVLPEILRENREEMARMMNEQKALKENNATGEEERIVTTKETSYKTFMSTKASVFKLKLIQLKQWIGLMVWKTTLRHANVLNLKR